MENTKTALDLIKNSNTAIGNLKVEDLARYTLIKMAEIAINTETQLKVSADMTCNGIIYNVFMTIDYTQLTPKQKPMKKTLQVLDWVLTLCKNGRKYRRNKKIKNTNP